MLRLVPKKIRFDEEIVTNKITNEELLIRIASQDGIETGLIEMKIKRGGQKKD